MMDYYCKTKMLQIKCIEISEINFVKKEKYHTAAFRGPPKFRGALRDFTRCLRLRTALTVSTLSEFKIWNNQLRQKQSGNKFLMCSQ